MRSFGSACIIPMERVGPPSLWLAPRSLLAYGTIVNAPPWDFGRLLGVYVTLFFLVAQIVNFTVFGVRPALPIYVGGSLIIAGGLVITLWRA